MKLRPLHDWAVIQRLDAEDKTTGGIIIPDTAKEKPAEGIIVAIGPGRYKPDKKDKNKKTFESTTLKPGQRIMYAKYMATAIEVDNEEITLVREEDILGTVEGVTQLAVRKSYAVKEKPAQEVVIKEKAEIAPVMPKKKPVTTKKAKKPAIKKKAKVKKTSKKAAPKTKKKTTTKKKTKKTSKKTTKTKKKSVKKTVKTKKKATKQTTKKTAKRTKAKKKKKK